MIIKFFRNYMDKMFNTRPGRNVLLLKLVVAIGIIGNHYFPGHLGLVTNLLWLFIF